MSYLCKRRLHKSPWYHNIAVIEKLDRPAEREWYARKAIANGWSRNILVHQIESRLHLRIGEAQTNFARTLPPPQSELAQQLLKDLVHLRSPRVWARRRRSATWSAP